MVENSPEQRIEQLQASPEANVAAPNLQQVSPQAVAEDALLPANAVGEMNRLNQQNALEQIRDTLVAINEVTYLWSISDDQLSWSDNLSAVIPNMYPGRSTTGRGYASLLDHDNEFTRYDQIVGSKDVDQGQGVPFCIEYKLWPAGVGKGEPIWIEDNGRWYAGPEGAAGYAIGAIRVINGRKANEENLKFLSQRDPLTGMMNRGRIMEALGEAITMAERTGSSCSFILAAMDNLDVVNDAYGFDVADQVIAEVSQRLGRHMRSGDSIGRYAGNKFAIILGNCNESALKVACERFLQSVRQTVIETEKGPVWSSISIGGVVLPTHARQAYEAMVHAEDALAEAKTRPTDCFVTFKPSKRRASMRERNVSCAAEIVAALKQNRFVLAFQPIMNSETSQPAMYEALLRIAGHDGEVLSAGHLLAVAERLGLIRLIDRRVLEMGVAILKQQPTLRLTLNISGVTATDTRWFEMFVDYIAENKQVAERLTVEITETVALADLDEISQFIERLRSYGCKVAIDDFGAGYTSFRNLQVLNVDMVKLDGSFCEDLSGNPDNQYFVKTLVDMAKRFNIEIVAEWVQRQEDADLLREWGVKYLQGHLFGVASIDPPWGRLEQKFSSDEGELDPVRKVLHAGKPDFPGLRAADDQSDKWSPETHPDRRVSNLADQTQTVPNEAVEAPQPAALEAESHQMQAGAASVADADLSPEVDVSGVPDSSVAEAPGESVTFDPFAAELPAATQVAQGDIAPVDEQLHVQEPENEATHDVAAGVEQAGSFGNAEFGAADLSIDTVPDAVSAVDVSTGETEPATEQVPTPQTFSAAEFEDRAANAETGAPFDVPVLQSQTDVLETNQTDEAGLGGEWAQSGLTAHLTGRPLLEQAGFDSSQPVDPGVEAMAVEHPQYSNMQPAPEFEPAQPSGGVMIAIPQGAEQTNSEQQFAEPFQIPEQSIVGSISASHELQSEETPGWAGDIPEMPGGSFLSAAEMQPPSVPPAAAQQVPDPFQASPTAMQQEPQGQPLQATEPSQSPSAPQSRVDPFAMPAQEFEQAATNPPLHSADPRPAAPTQSSENDPFAAAASEAHQPASDHMLQPSEPLQAPLPPLPTTDPFVSATSETPMPASDHLQQSSEPMQTPSLAQPENDQFASMAVEAHQPPMDQSFQPPEPVLAPEAQQSPGDPFAATAFEAQSSTSDQQAQAAMLSQTPSTHQPAVDPFGEVFPESQQIASEPSPQPVEPFQANQPQQSEVDPFATAVPGYEQPASQLPSGSAAPVQAPAVQQVVNDPFAAAVEGFQQPAPDLGYHSASGTEAVMPEAQVDPFAMVASETPQVAAETQTHPQDVAHPVTQQLQAEHSVLPAALAPMPEPATMQVSTEGQMVVPETEQVQNSLQPALNQPADPEEFARKLQEALGPLMSGGK